MWLSIKHTPAKIYSLSSFLINITIYFSLYFNNLLLFLPCLCVPVKMSVGTETEKFWDSLWELQAECTGLLWVERHPWARGDLGQSARRERKMGGRFGHKQWETSQSECSQTGKKETHTRTNTTTIAIEWKRRQKRKRSFYSLSLPQRETHAELRSHIHTQQGCKHNRKGDKGNFGSLNKRIKRK